MITPLSVITININPVAFQLGSLAVRWYGIFYAVAFVVAYRFGVIPHIRNRKVDPGDAERVLTVLIIVGLIGGRLYYVLQQPDLVQTYLEHPLNIIAVWQGGMAFFGAIIAGALAFLFLAWRDKKYSFWFLFDGGVIFAVVGQPIGRIGNVINGDILGSASNAWFATAYTFHDSVDHCAVLQPGFQCGVGYQPAAVYEALGTIAIGLILFAIRSRGPRDGTLAITYVGLYAVSQFLLDFLRQSEPVIGMGLKQLQWTSLVVLVVAVPVLVALRRRFPGHGPPYRDEAAEPAGAAA